VWLLFLIARVSRNENREENICTKKENTTKIKKEERGKMKEKRSWRRRKSNRGI